ncbi:MAG: biotin--[acetyl-CoA-carboxylase] ligase [Cocleimonas sp.]|nr:biotin--[acetyl-CoA-carboxylase] ligase [Cocleimonas sp.]
MLNHKSLNIDQIKESTACGTIHYFESLNSTNSWLLEHGHCGDICISESQTKGRGRRGNNWVSPRGNIHFSLCWCFDEIVKHWSLLGLVTGIAIAEALQDVGLTNHGVKWPNDIFWQQKKLGGILLETIDQSGRVIIGIGLNIALPLGSSKTIGQPVTSLDEAMNDNVSKNELVTQLIIRLKEKLDSFKQLNFDQFMQSWQTWDILRGEQVYFDHQGIEVSGEVVEIDKHGRLGILKNTGELCFYSSADIRLKKG